MGIAAVVVGLGSVGRGDRAADDGGADEACADRPPGVEAMSLGRRAGGREAAGSDKGCDSDNGKLGLDRHGELHPVSGGSVMTRIYRLDEPTLPEVRAHRREILAMKIIALLQ